MKHYLALLVFSALLLGACDSQAPLSSDEDAVLSKAIASSTIESPSQIAAIPQQVELMTFRVCKNYDGVVGPPVTIDFTVDVSADGTVPPEVSGSVVLNDGECADIWTEQDMPSPDTPDEVTVTEQVPAGYIVTFEKTEAQRNRLIDPITTVVTNGTGNTVSGLVQRFEPTIGTLVVFTNTFDDPPPPPGDEGCTPGYWKNHLSAWEVYAPGDDFDTIFGVDLFNPDMNLEQALRKGGGKQYRLGRHGSAALLSAAHSGVAYPHTVAEVIALVQAGDADALEQANELGCPL